VPAVAERQSIQELRELRVEMVVRPRVHIFLLRAISTPSLLVKGAVEFLEHQVAVATTRHLHTVAAVKVDHAKAEAWQGITHQVEGVQRYEPLVLQMI
jgi:hypothetical protein